MSTEVVAVAQQLAQAVELMMNPSISQEQRHHAFQQLEQFKETSPLGSQCGFFLANINNSPVVRHFGLKILEDIVKMRWNEMSGEEKLFIKEHLLKLVEKGTNPLLTEHNHIKDELAKIVVELIKREWPQQWPSLLSELDILARHGETQTELVMFILRRLVEDVAVLVTLEQSQRRKEIYSALTANMDEIFRFLFGLLEKHYQAYLAQPRTEDGAKHCKVCMSILGTFTTLVEWVPMQNIMSNNKYLLHCLIHLLMDESLQIYAAECLLGVVGWKAGKMSDRAQLLCLFDSMQPLLAATEAAEKHALEENHYNFMKKMVQIFTVLGEQLCMLWTKESPREVPNLQIFLNILMALTRHPSHTINLWANELWSKFFRHADISLNEVFMSFQIVWLETTLKKVVRIPESTALASNPSSQYALLDFDDDDEFKQFFIKYRLCIIDVVKNLSVSVSPVLAFNILDNWLREVLVQQPLPPVSELEAIAALLDAVFFKITNVDALKPVATQTAALVKLCLDFKCDCPRVMSELISCISAMFVLTMNSPDALQPILQKVFSMLSVRSVSSSAQSVNMSNAERTLRRHCCALLIKLSTKFPDVMMAAFQFLHAEVAALNERGALSKMEFVTLLESLLILSNKFGQFDRQVAFIKSIAEPVIQRLKSLRPHYSSPENLMSFIGVDKEPVIQTFPPTNDNPHQENRSSLSTSMNFLLAVSRRVEIPTDANLVASGGYQIQADGKLITRNPAGSQMCSVLQDCLVLGHSLNLMFSDAYRARLNPGFAKAFDLLDVDKNNIFGLPGARSAKNDITYQIKQPEPVIKMQNFVTELFESVQHLLSHMSSNIGYEFYQQAGLAEGLCLSVLGNLDRLPDFRLRAINKMFLKTFINKCPVELFMTSLIPVLRQIVPNMRERLQERWTYLRKIRENPSYDEDNADSQEILDDVIITLSFREYLDTVKAMLTSGGGLDICKEEIIPVASLSSLGELVLSEPGLRNDVLLTCLQGLRWPDSPSGTRAAALVELILPVLCNQNALSPDGAASIMVEILTAFQEMGMHESNNIALTHLALLSYETLRPMFPNIVTVLQQVPGINIEDLMKFDMRIANKNGVGFGEKAKKDMFKKLISRLVGKDIAKLFQKEIVIKNLPSLAPIKTKSKSPTLDEKTTGDIGLTSLFNGS